MPPGTLCSNGVNTGLQGRFFEKGLHGFDVLLQSLGAIWIELYMLTVEFVEQASLLQCSGLFFRSFRYNFTSQSLL